MFGEQNGSVTPDRVGLQKSEVRLVAREHRQRQRAVLAPGYLAQVRVLFLIPFEPDRCLAAIDSHDADAHADVVFARARVKSPRRLVPRFGGVGDVPAFHLRSVAFLEGDPARIRRPPEAGEAVHLLLRHELGQPVWLRLGAAGRHGGFPTGGEVEHVHVFAAHVGNAAAIGREFWIDNRAWACGEFARGAFDAVEHVELAREAQQDERAVFRDAERRESAHADALAFAPRLFLGRQALGLAPERVIGREQAAGLAAGDVKTRRVPGSVPAPTGRAGRAPRCRRVSAWRWPAAPA